MRLCFIGDSTLAAVKLGWDMVAADYPHVDATFFGSHGTTLSDLAVGDGMLVPTTDGLRSTLQWISSGKEQIVEADYDCFILVSLGFAIHEIVYIYGSHRADSHGSQYGLKHLVSDCCFEEAARCRLRRSLALDIAAKLREITDKRVYLLPTPLPSEGVLAAPLWASLTEAGDDSALSDLFIRLSREFSHGSLIILDQPDSTKRRDILTKQEYSIDSVRMIGDFDVRHPSDDYLHMNKLYGKAILLDLLALVNPEMID
jgi:hypothetical protein